MRGSIIGSLKGDTRNLDYSSNGLKTTKLKSDTPDLITPNERIWGFPKKGAPF